MVTCESNHFYLGKAETIPLFIDGVAVAAPRMKD
jgi:hypothetical protein